MSSWSLFLGWGVFWIFLIVAIVLFSVYRKIYPVFYSAAVALYIFTAGFTIDVFHLEKIGIMTILVFSSVMFMALGYYLSKVMHLHR